MSTAKHTAGEWIIDPASDSETIAICNEAEEHVCVLQIDANYSDQLATANAKRIVACRNGCEGINPEAVQELLAGLKLMFAWHDELRKQGILTRITPYPYGYNEAREAIASATGEEVPA